MNKELDRKPPTLEAILLSRDEDGQYTLVLVSDDNPDVRVSVDHVVVRALMAVMISTLDFQRELRTLDPIARANFPLALAYDVIRGAGWFKTLSPTSVIAQKLNGMFGVGPPQEKN